MNVKVKKKTNIPVPADNPVFRKYIYLCIVCACFIFYGNTLTLDYAFDDLIAITGNQFTKSGFKGIPDILTTDLFSGFYGKDNNMVAGGRYRPLSIVTFAIEYQLFGANPAIGHLINILLLILTGILLYTIFSQLFVLKGIPPDKKQWYISVPLLATLFFVGHPVHTEVVANIKGRDEIFSLLLSLAALKLTLDYLVKNKTSHLVLSGIVFFLALLSKENAITFLAIIPLTTWFFTKYSFKELLFPAISLGIATLLFLILRQWVIGHNASGGLENDLMNNPFIEMTKMQKYATIMYTLGIYIKLLVFPHPLTYDYYPYHIPIVSWSEFKALLSLAVYLGLLIYLVLTYKKKEITTYAVLYYFITLSIVSNLLFPIGAFMNERFLYMPSVGFCLGLAWILSHSMQKTLKNKVLSARLVSVTVLVILSLYGVKTVSRNRDWADSYTLFTTDVHVSSNSAKGNALAGEYLIKKAGQVKDASLRDSLLRQSIKYQQKAVQIYPKQIIALFNLAAAYYEYNKNYDTILTVYSSILHYLPDNPKVYQNFISLMNQYQNTGHKIELYKRLYIINPKRFDVNINLGVLYLDAKDPVSAIPYLETAVRLNQSDFAAQNNLGMAYGMSNNWKGAKTAFEAAERIKPDDVQLLKNLAAVCQNLGQPDKSREYLEKAKKFEKR
ncbi:MAG: DUF1736 domain-containing protein [Bacteroidetes bacterium]|nr:DUF1736 domain-containing protein [Bacteroidota bacterium]